MPRDYVCSKGHVRGHFNCLSRKCPTTSHGLQLLLVTWFRASTLPGPPCWLLSHRPVPLSSYPPNRSWHWIVPCHKRHHPALRSVLLRVMALSPKSTALGRSSQWFSSAPPPRFLSFLVPNSPVHLLQHHVAFLAFQMVFSSFLVCPFPRFSNWHMVGFKSIFGK